MQSSDIAESPLETLSGVIIYVAIQSPTSTTQNDPGELSTCSAPNWKH